MPTTLPVAARSNLKLSFKHLRRSVIGLSFFIIVTGCVVNPVTGNRELGIVSFDQQIAIGKQHYLPAQQMQGGLYQVDPAVSAYVNRVGQKVAAESGVPLPYEFVVLNSSVPNAWALPGGKIAINRGLLTELRNEGELAAVLGHEAVHAAARHGAKAMERGMLLQGAMLATAIGSRDSEHSQILLGAAQMAAGLITTKYGRNAERESDFYGTEYLAAAGYDPRAAVTLQETFVRLSKDRPQSNWLQGLFASHPPSTERVENNKSIVGRLQSQYPDATRFGADDYERAVRTMRRDAPAYKAYDAARKAASEKDWQVALNEVNEALSLQPKEAAFHGLRGDIRYQQKRFDDAVTNYNRAVGLDDNFFSHYLGRGMANKALRSGGQAKRDLARSLELLPTAVAYNALGELEEAEGNSDAALRYYQAASGAQGEAGRTALVNSLRIDLPRNPSRYLPARIARDSQQRLVLQVANTTPVAVNNIEVVVELAAADGRRKSMRSRIPQLRGGATQLLQVAAGTTGIADARAYVVTAQLAN